MQDGLKQMDARSRSEFDNAKNLLRVADPYCLPLLAGLAKRFPDNREIVSTLGWAEFHLGDPERAASHYARLQILWPDNPDASSLEGDAWMVARQYDKAIGAYLRALTIHADYEPALIGLRYAKFCVARATNPEVVDAPPQERDAVQMVEVRKNVALTLGELEAQALKMMGKPLRVFMQTTTRCNFACQTCPKGYEPYYAQDMDPRLLDTVRHSLLPNLVELDITGFGEPMMSPRFDDMVALAREADVPVRFVTNGSFLTFKRIEQLLSGNFRPTISVDGASPEVYERIRRNGSFARLKTKLAMIQKVRRILVRKHSSPFTFNFVITRLNIHELPDVVRLAHKYEIYRMSAVDYTFQSTEFDLNSVRNDVAWANRWLDEADRVARELGVELIRPEPYIVTPETPSTLGNPQNVSRQPWWKKLGHLGTRRPLFSRPDRFPHQCHSPWTEVHINTAGIVTPCCIYNKPMGNLLNQSFEEIWNGPAYQMLRLRLRLGFPPETCRTCTLMWGINGGNPGNILEREGALIRFIQPRLSSLAHRIRTYFRRQKATPSPPPPPPNMHRGRTLKKSPAPSPEPEL